ncbi:MULTISPECIES: hypothetical protein [unclassified Moraxella]|uniref:hypothetical protein n=1 Tax=unclassified Moraxella TaxID=2685852 RepID=UPI00359CEFD4
MVIENDAKDPKASSDRIIAERMAFCQDPSNDCQKFYKDVLSIAEWVVPTSKEEVVISVVSAGFGKFAIKILDKVSGKAVKTIDGFQTKAEAEKAIHEAKSVAKGVTNPKNTTSSVVYIARDQEVRELFTAANSRAGIRIGNRTLLPEPNSQGLTRVFNGASDAEVKQYFTELTGKPLPNPTEIVGKGVVYSVTATDGKKYNLRNFASSSNITGPAWTIDIPKGVANPNKATEIKFIR